MFESVMGFESWNGLFLPFIPFFIFFSLFSLSTSCLSFSVYSPNYHFLHYLPLLLDLSFVDSLDYSFFFSSFISFLLSILLRNYLILYAFSFYSLFNFPFCQSHFLFDSCFFSLSLYLLFISAILHYTQKIIRVDTLTHVTFYV